MHRYAHICTHKTANVYNYVNEHLWLKTELFVNCLRFQVIPEMKVLL